MSEPVPTPDATRPSPEPPSPTDATPPPPTRTDPTTTTDPPAESFLLARWLFLRLVAVGFAASFLSLAGQIDGLIGPRGILPARDRLAAIAQAEGGPLASFLAGPSLLWLDAGPVGLGVIVWGGLAAAGLLLANLWPRASVLACWAFFLSFVAVAGDFSAFQSDGLLLEMALVGALVAPPGLRPGFGRDTPPSRLALLVVRWLLIRLMLGPGLSKLLSADGSWRTLTALHDYYENAPFPTWVGWWVSHLPGPVHSLACLFTLVVEVALAPLVLLGRRLRLVAFFPWVALQLGIALTGSYSFLNGSAIAIALFCVDDARFEGWVASLRCRAASSPRWRRIADRFGASPAATASAAEAPAAPSGGGARPGAVAGARRVWAGVAGGVLLYVSTLEMLGLFFAIDDLPAPLRAPVETAAPFRSANGYSLFAAMTHDRPQLELEEAGPDEVWRPYRWRWQPQALDARPSFMAPHLPRLDWNLWFAASIPGGPRRWQVPVAAARRLARREPAALALVAAPPTPEPGEWIRFQLVRYRFTTIEEWWETGRYWEREPLGEDWAPPMAITASKRPSESPGERR